MTSNDRIVCSINGNTFSGQNPVDIASYDYVPSHTIIYQPPTTDSNGPYTYNILCQNLAASPSAPILSTVTVNLAAALVVNILSPDQYVQSLTQYVVSTNKEASCVVKLDGGAPQDLIPVPGTNNRTHALAYTGTPLNGSHILTALCDSANEPKSATKQFTVDTTPPTTPTINVTACTSDKMTIVLSSIDNESTVKSYNYSVIGPNVTINWTSTTAGTIQLKDLKLNKSGLYNIQAIAMNGAGRASALASLVPPFTFNPNATRACQENNAPVISFNISNTTYGKKVALLCYDESGCVQSSIRYGLGATNCTPSIAGTEVILQKPDTICYYAQDTIGNNITGSKAISFESFAPSCSNRILDGIETDIDCGGTCSKCEVGLSCLVNTDC